MTRLLRRYNETMSYVLPATVSISCPPVCPSIMATITRIVRSIGFASNLPRLFFLVFVHPIVHVFSFSFGNSRTGKSVLHRVDPILLLNIVRRTTTLVLVLRRSRRVHAVDECNVFCVKEVPVTFSSLYCCTLQHYAMLRSRGTQDNVLFRWINCGQDLLLNFSMSRVYVVFLLLRFVENRRTA